MKSDGPIARPYDKRPVDCDANNFVGKRTRARKGHSRFCSHAILQQLQIRDDVLCPEADIDMGYGISVSSHPNNTVKVRWWECQRGQRRGQIAHVRKGVVKVLCSLG